MTDISQLQGELEQIRRDRASELWNAAGKPNDRDLEFWSIAGDIGPFKVCHKVLNLEDERKKKEIRDEEALKHRARERLRRKAQMAHLPRWLRWLRHPLLEFAKHEQPALKPPDTILREAATHSGSEQNTGNCAPNNKSCDTAEQHTAELHIRILPGGKATDAQIALFDRTRQVEIGIRRVLFPDLAGCNKPRLMRQREWDRRRLCHNDYLQWLTDAARVGLEHPIPQIALADRDLDNLCWDVLTRYGRVTRTRAIVAYGIALLCWMSATALLCWAIGNFLVHGQLASIAPWPSILRVDQDRLVTYVVALAGAAGGALLVFAQRSLVEDWPSLVSAASDTVRASIRAGYVLGFAFMALLMLRTGMAAIKIADFDSQAVFPLGSTASSIVSAILIGAFFGLADRTLPALVQQSARDTAGRLKGAS